MSQVTGGQAARDDYLEFCVFLRSLCGILRRP